MNKEFRSNQGTVVRTLEDLEKFRKEVHMTDDEYNIIKNILNGKDESYNSSSSLSKQEMFQQVKRDCYIFIIKRLIIFFVIVAIVVSFIWRYSSIAESRKNHPFTSYSAPALCGMSEKEFKNNLQTEDSIILNNAIKELDIRLKFLNSLEREPLHLKNEKKIINDRLLLLKNRLSELEK